MVLGELVMMLKTLLLPAGAESGQESIWIPAMAQRKNVCRMTFLVGDVVIISHFHVGYV